MSGPLISWVGPISELPSTAGKEVVDLRDSTVMPGLIDGHVHLLAESDYGDREVWDRSVDVSDDRLVTNALENAARALVAGVTTVRDCGDREFLTLAVRDAVAARRVPGARILASGRNITIRGGHGSGGGMLADTRDEVVAAVRFVVARGVDHIKVIATGGNMSGKNVLTPYYSLEVLNALVEEAHRLGRRVAAHAHGTDGIRTAVLAGVDTIEHCSWLGSDGRDYDESVVEEMVRRGTFVDFTPAAAYRLVEDPETKWTELRTRLLRVRHVRVPTMLPMRDAGVAFFFGSDAAAPGTAFEDFVLNLEMAVRLGGIPVADVLSAATRTAAAALGLADSVGMLAVGMRADLIAVHGDPLDDIRRLRKVDRVYRDGELVVEQGLLRFRPLARPEMPPVPDRLMLMDAPLVGS